MAFEKNGVGVAKLFYNNQLVGCRFTQFYWDNDTGYTREEYFDAKATKLSTDFIFALIQMFATVPLQPYGDRLVSYGEISGVAKVTDISDSPSKIAKFEAEAWKLDGMKSSKQRR